MSLYSGSSGSDCNVRQGLHHGLASSATSPLHLPVGPQFPVTAAPAGGTESHTAWCPASYCSSPPSTKPSSPHWHGGIPRQEPFPLGRQRRRSGPRSWQTGTGWLLCRKSLCLGSLRDPAHGWACQVPIPAHREALSLLGERSG